MNSLVLQRTGGCPYRCANTPVMYERMRVIYRHTDVGDIGPNLKGVKDVAAKKVQ